MRNKNKIVAASVAVLVVLGVLVYGFVRTKQERVTITVQKVDNLSAGERKVANAGSVISGFPLDLVINKDGDVKESSITAYEQNTKQLTAEFATLNSLQNQHDAYVDYLTKNKYKVTKQGVTEQSAHIYASNDRADVNILIRPDGQRNLVSIIYLLKK